MISGNEAPQIEEDQLPAAPMTDEQVTLFNQQSDKTPTTFGRSVFNSFIEGASTQAQIFDQLSKKPDPNLKAAVDSTNYAIEQQDKNLSTGQKVGRFVPNFLASVLGTSLNPFALVAATATGGAADVAAGAISRLAPEAINIFARKSIPDIVGSSIGKYLPETIGQAATTSIVGGGVGAGQSMPDAYLHVLKGEEDWRGAAKEVGENGAIGMALTLPFHALHVGVGKIYQSVAENIENRFNKKTVEFASPEDVETVKGVTPDQISHGVEDNTALSDYAVNKNFDAMRDDPEMLPALKDHVDFIDQRFEGLPGRLSEIDKMLDEHLYAGMEEKMPFDQKDIYDTVKSLRSNGQQIPFTIPKEVAQLINHESKSVPEGQEAPIAPELKSPVEELKQIREKLLTDKGLPKNYKMSKDYGRLMDLSDVWENAKTLLDRVNLEEDRKYQGALRDMSQGVINTLESGEKQFSDPARVQDYLRDRMDQHRLKRGEIPYHQEEEKPQDIKAKEHEQSLEELFEQVSESSHESVREDFKEAKEKYEQFKKSEESLQKMLDCMERK